MGLANRDAALMNALRHIGVAFAIAIFATLVWLAVTPRTAPDAATSGWEEVAPFQHPRRALAAVAHNGFIYVVGGLDEAERYVREVEYAPILPDGRLGAWRVTSPLQEGRFYLGVVAANDHLYAIGGANGELGADNVPSATVERARILADGSLGPWERDAYLTTPRRGLKTLSDGKHIYALGGYNGKFLKSVERAAVLPDGRLGAWQLEAHEARVDRYIHAAARRGENIYLLGGHVEGEGMSYGDVEATQVRGNGALHEWRIQPTRLLTPRFIAEAFTLRDHIYILGGHDGARRLDTVEYAALDGEGNVGPWRHTARLRHTHSATAVATHGDCVYVFGGMGESGVQNKVEMACRRMNGTLGAPSP